MHSQCASNVCLPTGSCGDGSDTAFVTPDGDGFACTADAPCASVNNALATNRPYVKISGTIRENVTINRSNPVVILADPDAKLTAETGDVLQVLGASVATIYDLEISGSKQTTGIFMPTGQNANVTVERVKITNHGDIVVVNNGYRGGVVVLGSGRFEATRSTFSGNAFGVQAHGGGHVRITESELTNTTYDALYASTGSSASVFQSTFAGNGKGLILYSGGIAEVTRSTFSDNGVGLAARANTDLTLQQSTIIGNSRLGLAFDLLPGDPPSKFHVINNFIVRNGTSTSDFGGVAIFANAAASGSDLRFNTIVGNSSNPSVGSGVDCFGGVSASGNIIVGNAGKDVNSRQTCSYGSSLIGGTTDDIGFANPNSFPYNYHLTASTPTTVRDAVDCDNNRSDIDGNMRPQGGSRCDLGADEYKP